MGFPGYFLIVADFIRWARENGIPVGPGRGSGAGSLVAYVLGITDLDPLDHDLLFERFLNPERVSMPDFDVDFCMEGRDRVIDYVAERYGRERVSQIITYGTMAAKAVVRDAGRVLGHPYGFVDRIAKLIPNELDITLDAALKQEPELRKRLYDRRTRRCANADRPRALARGPDAQRRQARRRRGDRAVGAHRLHAAVPRRGRAAASSRSSTRTTSRRRAWSSSTSSACAR
jgi:DNA polymerase III subunit alpha